jgi:hypothetical protein
MGTLKVYCRMYALRARRATRRGRHRRILAAGPSAWVVTLHSPRNGLFAHLSWCVAIWARAQASASRVTVRATSPQYGQNGGDWFGSLFLNRQPASEAGAKLNLILKEYEEWPEYRNAEGPRSRAQAATLFYHYSGLQPGLLAEAERFCAEEWGSGPVLGVHYRGTDKGLEAPPVPAATMIDHVRQTVALWPELKVVFVASDEENFPAALRAALPGHRVVCLEDVLRSGQGRAIHHLSHAHGPRRAHEAVLDCLLLSKTSLLLKTASMLSGWAAILTPGLPTILVNPPHPQANFFPDSILRDRLSDLPARLAVVRAARQDR